jgi:hypothetical protein
MSEVSQATLDHLVKQVEGMGQVFADASRAKAEQRKFLEERHRDVMCRVDATAQAMEMESKRLVDTLGSYQLKTTHDLLTCQTKLTEALNQRWGV